MNEHQFKPLFIEPDPGHRKAIGRHELKPLFPKKAAATPYLQTEGLTRIR